MQRFLFASLGSGDSVRPGRELLREFPWHPVLHRTHPEKITCPSPRTTPPRPPHPPLTGNLCALTAATASRSAARPWVFPAPRTSLSTNQQGLPAKTLTPTFPAPSTTPSDREASQDAPSSTASEPAKTSLRTSSKASAGKRIQEQRK